MKYAYLLFLCLWLSLATETTAQPARFANHHLRQLATMLQAGYGMDCTHPGSFDFGENRLRVTQDSLGRIAHIGLELFPEDMIRDNPSPVYSFVERYLLELYLQQELPTPEQRLTEDKVSIRFAGHEKEPLRNNIAHRLPRFQENTSLLMLTDNNRYSVSIYTNQQLQLSIRFPIRYELLWGMNKIEAENGFYESLMYYQMPQDKHTLSLSKEEYSMLEANGNGIFVWPGDSYIVSSVNNDRFYRLTSQGEYVPVCDRQHMEESVRNLFLLSEMARNVTVNVKQRLYKRRTLEFEVPLQKLLSFCHATGCQPFVGIETCTADSVTGTVILLNPSYGYCHQFYFQVCTDTTDVPDGFKIDMELYAFVPTHNIGSLFYEKEK